MSYDRTGVTIRLIGPALYSKCGEDYVRLWRIAMTGFLGFTDSERYFNEECSAWCCA